MQQPLKYPRYPGIKVVGVFFFDTNSDRYNIKEGCDVKIISKKDVTIGNISKKGVSDVTLLYIEPVTIIGNISKKGVT